MTACARKRRLIPVRLYNLRTCQLGKKWKRGRPESKYTEITKKHVDKDKKLNSPVTLTDRLSRKAPLSGRSTWICY